MPKILPQFPLQLVVFPGEKVNLHIFEPRYKQLIKDCQEEKILFGIPTIVKNKPFSIGTIIELDSVSKSYDNGNLDIKCKGKQVYRIKNFIDPIESKLYAGANIEKIQNDNDLDIDLNSQLISKIKELYQFMNIGKEINEDPYSFNLFSTAHKIGLTLNQEIQLLSIASEKERQLFTLDHLVNLLPVVKRMELMRRKIQMNGHFKNIKSTDSD